MFRSNSSGPGELANGRAPQSPRAARRARARPAVGPAFLRLAIACAALVLLVVDGRAETLTIATYNVENYVPTNRLTESGYRTDYPKPESEKAAVRRVIRAIAADVLVLQEMGPKPYLDELQRDLRNEGADYPHAALGLAADADRHVAILSRRPFAQVATESSLDFAYLGGRERVKRGVLVATVRTNSGDVTLFAIHLKSRFTDRPDDPASAIRRAGEAVAIRDLVLRRFPKPAESRFVILGDCNDGKASRTLSLLQKRGKTSVVSLLPAADSRGEIWTHFYRREETYTRVDHIFVSSALRKAVRDNVARVFDGDGTREASDHRPVYVVFDFGPAT